MEKVIENLYELNCEWFANGTDASGNRNNKWKGNIICYNDKSCIGYAVDAGHKEPTHLLVGTFADDLGLSICKIHAKNDEYDPIFFDVFVNSNGEKGTYYGDFSAMALMDFIHMGVASISAKQKQKDSKEIEKIENTYAQFSEQIKAMNGFQRFAIESVEFNDSLDVAEKIGLIVDEIKFNQLPPMFKTTGSSQPGNGNN